MQTGCHGPQGTDDMLRGADVGICVQTVQRDHDIRQHVIPGIDRRPKILTGGKCQKGHCGKGKGKYQKAGIFQEHFRIIPESIQVQPDDQEIPQHIKNQKAFVKRNDLVNRAEDGNITACRMEAFQQQIPEKKQRPEEEEKLIIADGMVHGDPF